MVNLPHTIKCPNIEELFHRIQTVIPNGPKRLEYGGSVGQTDEIPHSYHRSYDDSPHDNGYSVFYFGDHRLLYGKTEYACALDLTFPAPEDMVKYTSALHRLAVHNNGKLYWKYGLREFAGTVDNTTVFAMDTTRGVRTYGWDNSHLYHIHLSFNRRLVTSSNMFNLVSAFKD